MCLQGFSRCQNRNAPEEQRFIAEVDLSVGNLLSSSCRGVKRENRVSTDTVSKPRKAGLFLTQLPASVSLSLSVESSSVGSHSAMFLGAASVRAQIHHMNWLPTVVSTLQCLACRACFSPASNMSMQQLKLCSPSALQWRYMKAFVTWFVSRHTSCQPPAHSGEKLSKLHSLCKHVIGCHCCWHDNTARTQKLSPCLIVPPAAIGVLQENGKLWYDVCLWVSVKEPYVVVVLLFTLPHPMQYILGFKILHVSCPKH